MLVSVSVGGIVVQTHRIIIAVAATALACSAVPTASANVSIPAGATLALNGGQVDAANTNIELGGSLQLGSGSIANTNNFRVASGASAQLGSGSIQLRGNWSNFGNIAAGSSQVAFTDGGSTTSAILGATTFNAVSFISATGKTYQFDAGQTQIVNTALTIDGSATKPIQFASTAPGSTAFIDLLAAGSQSIAHVGVSDVHASGQHLAPALHNEGGSGNDYGWFRSGVIASYLPVPTLSHWAAASLLLLLWLLGSGAVVRDRKRARHVIDSTTP